MMPITSFSAAMIDLSQEEARRWLAEILKKEMLDRGVKGWMADFAEAFPFDARPKGRGDVRALHNDWPVLWAQFQRELIEKEGKLGECLIFHRSGYTRSPRYATAFWLGDQLQSWDEFDGIKTVVRGLISSGLSGLAYNHSDIGGYTAVDVPGLKVTRSAELLQRWMELAALTPIFRSHEGNQPDRSLQVDSSPELLQQLSRCARLFQALGPYRRGLMKLVPLGLPLIRPLWLIPGGEELWAIEEAFALGDDLVFWPVLNPNQRSIKIQCPAGDWQHLWTGRIYKGGSEVSIGAPIGEPAILIRAGSELSLTLPDSLKQRAIEIPNTGPRKP